MNYSKCAWWPDLQSHVSATLPSLLRLLRPEDLRLLWISFGQARNVQKELDPLMHTQATLFEELVTLAERDPNVAVTLIRFYLGPHLNNRFRALPKRWGVHLAERNDHLTLNTVERLVHGFALERSSPMRIQVEKQVSLSMRVWGLVFSHGLNTKPAAVVVTWTIVISTLTPFEDRALDSLRPGLIRASADYSVRPTRECRTICEEAADSLHTPDILYAVPIFWDLLFAI